jgi:beta-lactamase regulating signal transducer with metallopeptidase domain
MIAPVLQAPVVQPVLAWLLTYAVHSTALLGSVWLLCRLLRNRALWLQDSLWKMALVGGIVTASVQMAAGVQPLAGRIPLATAHAVAAPSTPDASLPPLPQPHHQPAVAALLTLADAPPAPLAARPSTLAPGAGTAVLGVLGGLWLAIGLVLLARRGRALWRLRTELAERQPVEEPHLLSMVDALRRAGDLPQPVRLSFESELAVPLAMGVLRPEICLPLRVLTDLGPEQQRAVLAHEVAHLLRRDPAWLLAARAIESVLFFQPLNRLAGRRMQALSEYLCDDWSVSQTGRHLVFARCLTEVAGWVVAPQQALLPCMARRGSELAQRIGRLLEQEVSPWPTRRPRWLSPLLGVVLVAVAACAPRVCQVAAASPMPVPWMEASDEDRGPAAYPPIPPMILAEAQTAPSLSTTERRAAETSRPVRSRVRPAPAVPPVPPAPPVPALPAVRAAAAAPAGL